MNIDRISESAWTAVISGSRPIQFEFLALQLLLVQLRNRLQARETSIQDCIGELKSFYAKFSRLPMAENDFRKIADREIALTNRLLNPEQTARRIKAGQSLVLAGEEALLAQLPPGNWIGGTIPYFMTKDGGCLCKDKLFVTEIPHAFEATVQRYAASDLRGVYQHTTESAVSLIILPADSAIHTEFALHAPNYAGFAQHPLVGWVAGVDMALLGQVNPKVFCGSPLALENAAVVMHLKLPADCLAQINIISPFEPDQGDIIRFPATGFSATTAVINGREQNFAEYLRRIRADTRLPLVANYCGARINVSLKAVDAETGRVDFFAPVVAGIQYQRAQPVRDFVAELDSRLKNLPPDRVLFSCNCILNYLHSHLEGRHTGALVGPVTFGEIAFQLLNQTLVYLEIVQVESPAKASNATSLELTAAHQELQASEQRFRTLTESAPFGVFMTDATGRLLYENECCRKLNGVSPEVPTTGAWMQSVHPTDLPELKSAIESSEREGRDFKHEFRFVRADGEVCWVHARTTSLRSESGTITGRIGIVLDVSERKQAEFELERVHQDLMRASREAGMAELATGVLHNVKNVINSINVSAGIIADQLQESKASNLAKVTALLREHANDLGAFITEHPKGKLLPEYLEKLAERLASEHAVVLKELQQFERNVEHIKDVVTMQQSYARRGGSRENARPADLMDDSLRIIAASLARHGIQVMREYEVELPDVTVEKHKVLQILVNLIRNAKQACQAAERTDRKLVLSVTNGGEFVRFAVKDNGVGIATENLARLFEHGFTTKKDGHGFGLHSAALVAKELGGSLDARSEGAGQGATFVLTLPPRQPAVAQATGSN